VVVFGDSIEWAPSLDEAMAEVFDLELPEEEVPDAEEPPEEEPDVLPGSVQQLLDDAADLLQRADEALRAGDLGEYQRLVEEAAGLIEQAREAGDDNVEAGDMTGLLTGRP
jgi:hypothetical protein